MTDDSGPKGTNRRLLLMSAWTAPVIASFALGGLASAETFTNGNLTLGSGGAMAKKPAKAAKPVKPAKPLKAETPKPPN